MNSRFSLPFFAALAIPALGCNDVSWPSMRNVTTLRVLGVKAEPPSITPGQSTQLSLLCEDGANGGTSNPNYDSDASPPESIEVAWFAGCDNPPNNDPLKCLDGIAAASGELAPTLSDTPASARFAVSPTFDFATHFANPDEILRGQVTLSGQTVRYGVSYVYFVACAGKLHRVDGVTDRLPVECRDPQKNVVLDQTRYVAGYTTIYTYDSVQNANPVLEGARLDCYTPVGSCNEGDTCTSGFRCTTESPWTVHPCNASNPQTCRAHCIDFQVPLESFQLHTSPDGSPLSSPLKSLWAEYYTNAGHVPDDADARFGLSVPQGPDAIIRSPCAVWQAPVFPTNDARVWIVVRDDRGGLSWLEQRIVVQ